MGFALQMQVGLFPVGVRSTLFRAQIMCNLREIAERELAEDLAVATELRRQPTQSNRPRKDGTQATMPWKSQTGSAMDLLASTWERLVDVRKVHGGKTPRTRARDRPTQSTRRDDQGDLFGAPWRRTNEPRNRTAR